MQIKNLKSARSGREVANQVEYIDSAKRVFFSYGTPVAIDIRPNEAHPNARLIHVSESAFHSRTTLKYACAWLGVSGKKELQKAIAAGRFTLVGKIHA